jgi:hypothetical protein
LLTIKAQVSALSVAGPFAYVRLHSWIGDLRKCNAAAITVEQMVTPSKNFLKKQSGVKLANEQQDTIELMSNKIQQFSSKLKRVPVSF